MDERGMSDLPDRTAQAIANEVHKTVARALFGMERNPDRRWWQVWKPRWVRLSELQCFEVMR